jgi:RimJ/RimL family protein N-acetyltransferase
LKTEKSEIKIRKLELRDARAYRTIRLEMLKNIPTAYGMSYEEEVAYPFSFYEENFRGKWATREDGISGAFDGETLVGTMGLFRNSVQKEQQTAVIWGMYVKPSHQRRGIARALMEAGIESAKTWKDLIQITLTVEAQNRAAIKLYQSLGFKSWGIQPRALKIEGQYYDEDHMCLSLID